MARELLKDHMASWGLGIILIEGDSSKWFTHGGSNLGYRCTMLTRMEDGFIMQLYFKASSCVFRSKLCHGCRSKLCHSEQQD